MVNPPRFVPFHLRRTYPADFSVFLGLVALAVTEGWNDEGLVNVASHIIGVAAAIAAILLVAGWLWDSRRMTYEGAWLAVGVWTAELVEAAITHDVYSPVWWFVVLISISMVNLAVGVWWFVRGTNKEGGEGEPVP
jgi:hypothetical protein